MGTRGVAGDPILRQSPENAGNNNGTDLASEAWHEIRSGITRGVRQAEGTQTPLRRPLLLCRPYVLCPLCPVLDRGTESLTEGVSNDDL